MSRFALVALLGGTLACGDAAEGEMPPPDLGDETDQVADDASHEPPPPELGEEAAASMDAGVGDPGRTMEPEAGSARTDAKQGQTVAQADAALDVDEPADASVDAGDASSRPRRRDGGSVSSDAALDARVAARADASVDATVPCAFSGRLSYTLMRAPAPTREQMAAYTRITGAMDTAVAKYNCYANVNRALQVSYDPGLEGSEGRANGTIRFGSQASMNFINAMHEIAHTLGVGTTEFRSLVANRVFTGESATAELRTITGMPTAVVNSDGDHFWPYGLNAASEYRSENDAVRHCAMVQAIRRDLRL